MEFESNMVTKDGKKMMYLISIGVNKDCEDYDAIWAELERRMNAVSIPIKRVDWLLYDDNGNSCDFSDCLFYAQTFETGMGFVHGLFKDHIIRSNLEFCFFFNGDADKSDNHKYDKENPLKTAKRLLADNELIQSKSLDINQDIQHLSFDDNIKPSQIWTINFDLDTKNSNYKYEYYKTIHNFLAENGFEYKQHSGDISILKMDSEEVITILDDLYTSYPQIKACTKSCLFTSIDENYSFIDVRKGHLNTEPKESEFTMHFEIKKSDMKDIFKTVNTELLESFIRNFFKYPWDIKEHMSYKIMKKPDGSISIDWVSDMPINILDKTIATNHIFKRYPKLLETQRNIIFEMKYGENTTSLIADQLKIMSEEKKRLLVYNMSSTKLGKKEYHRLNGILKRRLARYGLKPMQESVWVSKNGMTDEQIQAILTELCYETCFYGTIIEVMDISVISNEIYDYTKLNDAQKVNSGDDNEQNSSLA